MASTTKTRPDKIKLLDQMLEDMAGDEFEDFDEDETSTNGDVKRYAAGEDLDFFDTTH
jgi:hypothetical protein